MKKYYLFFLLSAFYLSATAVNPLLEHFKTPHGTVPFNKIKNKDFIPAFDESCRQFTDEINEIISNEEAPTFENTIVAIERSGSLLKRVSSIFNFLLDCEDDDSLAEIAKTFSPAISECYHNIYLNSVLFERVKLIYDRKKTLNLLTEDSRLLEKTYKKFFDKGANLSEADKEKYRKLSTELILKELEFKSNKQKDENRFELLLNNYKDIAGIPSNILETASNEAKERGKKGYLFTLADYSYLSYMRFGQNRTLRKQMYMARTNVGNNNNEFDNKEILRKIVNLRLEIARLLGYENYSSYILKNRMAKNEGNVRTLMDQLLANYKPLAVNEFNTLQGFVYGNENVDSISIMPWDWYYYSERLKSLQFNITDEKISPYFELDRVRQGVFNLATQLYGLTFKENKKIQTYHPDVTAYEVFDKKGKFIAVLYADFLQRLSKFSGSWMNAIQNQYIDEKDIDHRPHVVLVMNFGRPGKAIPSLLTYSEVETFLHEFGHALHEIFSECTYESLSGTNVDQDFVELPSQIMESWLKEKEFLDQFAVHYQTGEKIPSNLVRKLIDATNFNVGTDYCRQIGLSLLDLSWHNITTPFNGNLEDFERSTMKPVGILPEIPNTLLSASFEHIFSDDGYAVGYYGYKWSEVLVADAFNAFKETGIFSIATADAFREHILSRGDTDDPNNLYIRFRCKQPTIDALLKRNWMSVSFDTNEMQAIEPDIEAIEEN